MYTRRNDTMKNFFKLLQYVKPYKKWAILAPLLIFLEVIMDLLLPSIMKDVVNIGIGERNTSYIIQSLVIMIALTILGMIGGIGSVYYSAKVSGYAGSDLRKNLFSKITNLSFFNLDKLKTGHLITILTNDVTLIASTIMMCLRFVFRVPIIMIGSFIMAILISPKLSMILIFLIPIILIVTTIIMKKAFPYFGWMQESIDNVNGVVRENLNGIRVVKAFVREKYEVEKFNKVNQHLMDISVKGTRIIMVAMPMMMLIVNLATIGILWLGDFEIQNGNLAVGDIMAFIEYLTNILTSLLMASVVIVLLSRSEASAVRIHEVLELEDDIQNVPSALSIEDMKGKVEFKNVYFSYNSGSGDAVLKNITFVANPGETIGIIGGTGSGKSTLVNLLPRFYDVVSGKILIDDVNIKDYNLEYLRSKVSIALQKPFLFSNTIRYNISYGNPNATEEEMIQYLKAACAYDFVMEKEKGLEYHLEQRGVNLSGGQKQRLSLARALIHNPKILILDDTLSAVDMKTDREIRENLKPILKDKTTFIIASKIASILHADKILVLDDGEIVGIGTHEELLAQNEVYQEIYHSQIEKEEK